VNRIAIFEELDEDLLNLLSPLLEAFFCQTGTTIFQQGDPADFLYLIVDGKVDMSFKPYDGMPITISHVSKGGLFGWSAVVGSDQYTSTAIAIEDVEAFRVHGRDLRSFCREYPQEGENILEHLADGVSSRWKDAHKQVQSILFQAMTEKRKLI
jgi:CRP-like cAMP-binding protein